MKDVEFSIQIKTKDMYIFQMRHAYLCLTGFISVLVSIIMLVVYILSKSENDELKNLLLLFGAALFTIIHPIQTWFKSYKIVMLTPVFRQPINYKITKEGVNISQNNEVALLPWADITNIKETKSTIYVYTSPKNAYIMPKEQYTDKVKDFKDLINNYIDKTTCKLELIV